MCLLRPVSAEIKDKLRYFSRLVLDVWVLDDHLDIFSDNHHVDHEQEAKEEGHEYLYIAFAQLYHLLSYRLNVAYHWSHENLQGFAA